MEDRKWQYFRRPSRRITGFAIFFDRMEHSWVHGEKILECQRLGKSPRVSYRPKTLYHPLTLWMSRPLDHTGDEERPEQHQAAQIALGWKNGGFRKNV